MKTPWIISLALWQLLLPGCGKKGPPLAPLLRVPARVEQFEAVRLGSVVYLQARVPDRNQDGSSPADISHLEIIGYTGDPPTMADLLRHGTLVASLPVRRPPEPTPPPPSGKPGRAAAAPPKKPAAPAPVMPGFDQGALVTVTETLTPALLTPVVLPGAHRFTIPEEPPIALPLLGPTTVSGLSRTYVAVGYNHSDRRGAPSAAVIVPLVQPPQPPEGLEIKYAADHVTLTWKPPVKLRRQIQEPASAGALAAVPLVQVLPGSAYNVYEVEPPPAAPTSAARRSTPPVTRTPSPLNPQPVTVPAYEDPRVAYGIERCYVVRTLDTFETGRTVSSEPSGVGCVTPKDTFAPAAPRGLQAVAGDGAISLIWEPNLEADLAGYLVLRAVAPGGTFERVTAEPIRDTTYNDATVKSGVRYVYAVVAVDNAVPFNTSPASNKVEVVAR